MRTEHLWTCRSHACDTHVARKNGGIFSPSSCTVDSDCTCDDLNPCGCDEAYQQAAFPFVIENEVYKLIALNQAVQLLQKDTLPTGHRGVWHNGILCAPVEALSA
ncbi:MAG: hypothetical protein R3E66_16100 [bacterium]